MIPWLSIWVVVRCRSRKAKAHTSKLLSRQPKSRENKFLISSLLGLLIVDCKISRIQTKHEVLISMFAK
ncbi:hypothetical protein WN51_08034 [Melipona quadrifasciata]|uniref:Uncharacterized protein n=1 Tax=Melipona quadrifasciata TaxID=166423 RepID=A0A0M8ZQV9_9HYME|nr:hypothetical protein WN51_08034 [Melipona quadrifasciata]